MEGPGNNRGNFDEKACIAMEDYTFKSPYSQRFSLPRDTMNYIIKNPKTPNGYQRLMKTCKYFYFKNPISIIDFADCKETSWILGYGNNKTISGEWKKFEQYICKFWFAFGITFKNLSLSNYSNILIQKLFPSQNSQIDFYSGVIYFENLITFNTFDNLKIVRFTNCNILYSDMSTVPVEKIFEIFPNVEEFSFNPLPFSRSYYTAETAKTIIQHKNFTNLKSLYLRNINNLFDIQTFYEAMKKQKQTDFCLYFCGINRYIYKNKIQNVINDIIDTYSEDECPPLICHNEHPEYSITREMRKKYKSRKENN